MRFNDSMISDLGNCLEETVIVDNEMEAKRDVQILKLKSKVLESKLIYK